MQSINLIFGCHSHQPVGNFGFVFEDAYRKAYRPFINVLERYPDVRVTLHYTGPLWDWFLAHEPEFVTRLAQLVRRGQVEIMGGGYYEPLLCAIPEADAIAQIRRMQDFCRAHFGATPRGMWLTERVWEPQMARILAKAGVEYTALDDTHFTCSGLPLEELFGYYVTEDEGLAVKVFPILEKLRYAIPFHQVFETIDFLRENATEDGLRCAVIHDDGEKFGIWPHTYHSVYEEGWLEEFFAALTENKEWLHSVTYSQYLDRAKAAGRVYLTCASYEEMMAWALPTPIQRRLLEIQAELKQDPGKAARYGQFIRGSFWRNFLAKYAESNNLQKRMLRVSDRLKRAQAEYPQAQDGLGQAEQLLHEGQCNCAYWHGVFGGLYLNHLRTAIYEKLVAADKVLDGLEGRDAAWVSCEAVDFDADGNEEAVIENTALALFFSPADGGTLFELDYKVKPFNLLNTLTRREEPYHDALRRGQVQVGEAGEGGQSIHDLVRAKEAGLDTYLVYDPYRRVSLRDHFLEAAVTADALWAGTYRELGDFATAGYAMETARHSVDLFREGRVSLHGSQAVRVRKRVLLAAGASAFEIRYHIEHAGDAPFEALFGVEFAVNFLSGTAADRYYRSDGRDWRRIPLGERGCDGGLGHIAVCDDWQHIEFGLRFSEPARVHRFALETVSQSEGGQERVYQGSVVVPCWPVALRPRETVSRTIYVEVINTEACEGRPAGE